MNRQNTRRLVNWLWITIILVGVFMILFGLLTTARLVLAEVPLPPSLYNKEVKIHVFEDRIVYYQTNWPEPWLGEPIDYDVDESNFRLVVSTKIDYWILQIENLRYSNGEKLRHIWYLDSYSKCVRYFIDQVVYLRRVVRYEEDLCGPEAYDHYDACANIIEEMTKTLGVPQ